MNVSEAQDLNALFRSLTTDATDSEKSAGSAAADRLAKRARAVLDAGPVGPQAASLVEDVQDAVRVAADDPEWMVRVTYPVREVENNTTQGALL